MVAGTRAPRGPSGSFKPFLGYLLAPGSVASFPRHVCHLFAAGPVPGTVLGPELLFHPGVLAVAAQMGNVLKEGLPCHPTQDGLET